MFQVQSQPLTTLHKKASHRYNGRLLPELLKQTHASTAKNSSASGVFVKMPALAARENIVERLLAPQNVSLLSRMCTLWPAVPAAHDASRTPPLKTIWTGRTWLPRWWRTVFLLSFSSGWAVLWDATVAGSESDPRYLLTDRSRLPGQVAQNNALSRAARTRRCFAQAPTRSLLAPAGRCFTLGRGAAM